MRVRLPVTIALLFLSVSAHAQDASYRALLARAQAGDTTVSFTALRQAWAASPEYAPYGSDADEHLRQLRAALDRSDWAAAVRAADAALAVTWLDAGAHVMKAYAAGQLGDVATAERERMAAARIVRSVADSGDGSQESPFVVVTVAEEYAYMGMNRLRAERQGVDRCGDRRCDRIDAEDMDTGEKRTLYFDITLPGDWLARSIRGRMKP